MLSKTRLSPDPAKHAMALAEQFGLSAARQLVALYAKDCPRGTYWPQALAALGELACDLAQESKPGRK
jgi:hypothetical protein